MAAQRSLFILWLLAAAAGCEQSTPIAPQAVKTNVKTAKELTPRDIVHNTIAAYRAALAYSDDGIVRLSYKQDGEPLEDKAPLAVSYAVPNRLAVQAYQTTIASDAKHLRAVIKDAATQDMDGQAVERPAPAKLTLDDLYSDAVLHDTLHSGLGRHPTQLELLFGEAPLLNLLQEKTPVSLLAAAEILGERCHRLETQLADGTYVFWIDESDYVLRRIEYPAAAMLPELARQEGVTELALVADFRNAKFSDKLPAETFALALPKGAQRVRHFVLPPQSLPSELFGKTPQDFQFTTAAEEPLTAKELAGKFTLLAWFSDDPMSEWGLQEIQAALEASTARDKFAAYVVAVEDRQIPTAQLAATLAKWQVKLPLLRDYGFAGRDVFEIKKAPSIVILDARGKVQIFEEGVNPNLRKTLPFVLERLAAGEDLAAQIVADARKAQEQYAADLAAASGETTNTSLIELKTTEPIAAREPEHFTRTKLWSTPEKAFAESGNFLIVRDKEQTHIYVVDGHRKIVELDEQGKTVATHQLNVPKDAGVSYLRTAVDKDGRRWFAGSAPLGRKVFVFNDQWDTHLSYPPDDQPHDGLHAIELADLAADGEPELYVGFWSLVGVQQVALDGSRKWTNRVLPTVMSLALTPPNEVGWRKILASGDRGALYRLNQYGHHDPLIEIPRRQVHRLAAASWNEGATAYCGISYLPEGRMQAIGLSADLLEMWNYKLPAGQITTPLEFVASASLRGNGTDDWLIAGPDGSVHIVSGDGEFNDTFAVGEQLTGLAAAQLGDARVVLTATKSGVTAWKLEKK